VKYLGDAMTTEFAITLSIPIHIVDIEELELYELQRTFEDDGFPLTISGKDRTPCAGGLVELTIASVSFLSGIVANHYGDKILDAIDRSVKKKIDMFMVSIGCGRSGVSKGIPRSDKKQGVRLLYEAFQELQFAVSTTHDGVFYLPSQSKINGEGSVDLVYCDMRDGNFAGSGIRKINAQHADCEFWKWFILRKTNEYGIAEEAIAGLKGDFSATIASSM
jgi:hypothetical protein